MTKSKVKKAADFSGIELHPDAWKRFESFVDKNLRTTAAKPTVSRAKAATRKHKSKG